MEGREWGQKGGNNERMDAFIPIERNKRQGIYFVAYPTKKPSPFPPPPTLLKAPPSAQPRAHRISISPGQRGVN